MIKYSLDRLKNYKIPLSFLVLIPVVVVGLYLRVAGLVTADLFRDEAFSGLLAQNSIPEIIRISALDTNPPLHPIILHVWGRLFGFSTIALRLTSFVAFLATLPILYRLLKSFRLSAPAKTSFWALYLLNPVTIYYAIEARYYGILLFLVLALLFIVVEIFWKGKHAWGWWISLIAVAIAGSYLHLSFLIVLAVTVGLISLRQLKLQRQNFWREGRWQMLFAAMLFAAICYIPWILILRGQLQQASSGFWLQFHPIDTLRQTLVDFFTWPKLNDFIVLVYVQMGLVFYATFCAFRSKQMRFLVLLTLGLLAAFYLVSFKQPLLYIRYVSFLVPLLLILVAWGAQQLRPRLTKVLLGVLVISYFVLNLTYSLPQRADNIPMSTAVEVLNQWGVDADNEIVLHQDALTYFNYEFYRGDLPNSLISQAEAEVPYYVGKALIPQSAYYSIEGRFLLADRIYYFSEGGRDQAKLDGFLGQGYSEKVLYNEAGLILTVLERGANAKTSSSSSYL